MIVAVSMNTVRPAARLVLTAAHICKGFAEGCIARKMEISLDFPKNEISKLILRHWARVPLIPLGGICDPGTEACPAKCPQDPCLCLSRREAGKPAASSWKASWTLPTAWASGTSLRLTTVLT